MKFEESKGIFIGGIILLICVTAAIYMYTRYSRQFPVDSLECKDAKFFRGESSIDMFSFRLENRGSFGVRDIKIRIGLFDTFGNPIDAVVVTFPETIPPRSSKLLIKRDIRIGDLPPTWKSTFTILEAKRAVTP